MIEWKPPRRRAVLQAGAAIAILILLDGLLFYALFSLPIEWISFFLGALIALSLPLLGLGAYLLYASATLAYYMDRDHVFIRCAGAWHRLPASEIQRATEVTPEMNPLHPPRLARLGYWLGRGYLEGGSQIFFYATRPLGEQLLLFTPQGIYAVSPANPQAFTAALVARQNLGPSGPIAPMVLMDPLWELPLWKDGLIWRLLGVSATLNAGLFAYLSAIYPLLPAVLPLAFDARGSVVRLGPKWEILLLPGLGAATLAINAVLGSLLHRREPLAAYLLAATAMLVQGVLIIAAWRIVF